MAQDLLVCLRATGQNARISTSSTRPGHWGNRPMYRVYLVGHGSLGWAKDRYASVEMKTDTVAARQCAGEGFIGDRVVSIEECQMSMTLDLSVPDGECYIANGAVSHNTTSIVAGVSSGIEPMFAPVYERRFNKHALMHDEQREQGVETVVHPLVQKFLREGRAVEHFEAAHEISPERHCLMQVTCQRHVDNAISKTINLPEDYPVADLSDIMRRHLPNLKGITLYRDGSRGASPLRPIPIAEAQSQLQELQAEVVANDCPNGKCEL
jgi:hypothetical protein